MHPMTIGIGIQLLCFDHPPILARAMCSDLWIGVVQVDGIAHRQCLAFRLSLSQVPQNHGPFIGRNCLLFGVHVLFDDAANHSHVLIS